MAFRDESLEKWLLSPLPQKPQEPTKKTLIIVVLDESGSMDIMKSDVIGGYNSFLDTQMEEKFDQARLMLIKFNDKVTVAHEALDLEMVPKLTAKSFCPGGGTALYDAVAQGINRGDYNALSSERVLVLIMTDGEENASKKAKAADVKAMIKEKEDTGRWTFVYIGEKPGRWAATMGQSNQNVIAYDTVAQGNNFRTAALSTRSYRTTEQMQTPSFFQPE